MIKRIICLAVALILSACSSGVNFSPKLKTEIGTDFKPYVAEFYAMNGSSDYSLIVKFGDTENGVGSCTTYKWYSQLLIKVNKAAWDNFCDAQRRAVIYHEMGHCILGRDHVSETVISYMLAGIISCQFYEHNRNELDLEIFEAQ